MTTAHNYLSENFYRVPHIARQTMTRAKLQATIHATDGCITANGEIWDIQSRNVAGAYIVTLKRREYT